ncbi:hypothetical protein ACEPAI_2848 [Sanghuangporus weigelae]
MISVVFLALALLQTPLFADSRAFTVTNKCSFTIWPALFTDLNVAKNVPHQPTGWEAPPGSSVSFSVPNNWASGRIWGRTGCDFSKDETGPGSCITGGCNGGLLCDPHTGIGAPPASLAEWTLGTNGSPDYYDVSLVDGFNLPIEITNNIGCPVASCPVNLDAICPAPLQGPYGSDGSVLGCKSACGAGLNDNNGNSPNCCTGTHNTPETCPPSGVDYYSFFKDNCPNAYAFAFDENSGTALWTCGGEMSADYTLTFCP